MSKVTLKNLENKIYIIRGQRVMLDSDLAELYGVETKVLNQAVKRNSERFPIDFMSQCNSSELASLRSQFVTANPTTVWNYKRRAIPYLFTENGVAMLSTVLNSSKAIQVNISIMRIFTKLRSFLLLEKDLNERVTHLEKGTSKLFKVVFERLDTLESEWPGLPKKRRKIGLGNALK
ncbi:MAG: ORF6N domain-containing protein [Epsilonproteobacteria bacterium]|nr:MAG: ORF6N domain-containing protein [Campylobacterota bacterium]RLA63754.1 MAG: ORF6N domain-containing protein [Campylobacterota bacterium]